MGWDDVGRHGGDDVGAAVRGPAGIAQEAGGARAATARPPAASSTGCRGREGRGRGCRGRKERERGDAPPSDGEGEGRHGIGRERGGAGWGVGWGERGWRLGA
ncbi:hypothetical protein ABZP36_009138 [Zizania latifolia]